MTPHPIAGPPHPDLGIALDALAPELCMMALASGIS